MEMTEILSVAGGGINTLLAFLVVLTILVFVHEFGHYWVAKKCGVKIEAFSIGFGPELFGWYDKSGTRWKFSLIPLGGYVKMFGDADPASTGLSEEGKSFTEEDKKLSFFHKPVSQRAAIVIAGPAANYLLALVLLTGLFTATGETVTPPVVGDVVPGMPAIEAGFARGDRIVSIDGKQVDRFENIQQTIAINSGVPVDFVVEREGKTVDLTVTPKLRIMEDRFGNRSTIAQIGLVSTTTDPLIESLEKDSLAETVGFEAGDRIMSINGTEVDTLFDVSWILGQPGERNVNIIVERNGERQGLTMTREEYVPTEEDIEAQTPQNELPEGQAFSDIGIIGPEVKNFEVHKHNIITATGAAGKEVWRLTTTSLKAIGQMIAGTRSVEELGGPLRIAKMSGDFAAEGPMALIFFISLISVSLGLINLMPVPVLDGGHLMFYAIEAVRGKALSLQAQEIGMRVGMAMVLCLVIFATFNDLSQLGVFSTVKDWVGLGS